MFCQAYFHCVIMPRPGYWGHIDVCWQSQRSLMWVLEAFLPLTCRFWIRLFKILAIQHVLMLGAQSALFHWNRSSTSTKSCDRSSKTNLKASVHVKYIKAEIKGNDQACSFSSDNKHFLIPSLKLNSQSKLTFYYALCNLRLLLPTSVILLLTELIA